MSASAGSDECSARPLHCWHHSSTYSLPSCPLLVLPHLPASVSHNSMSAHNASPPESSAAEVTQHQSTQTAELSNTPSCALTALHGLLSAGWQWAREADTPPEP